MKAIVVMYDTLNRHFLSPYGCDWTHTPNFARLAARCAVFDNHFVGSLPCMPARREMHTGRYNFLHRSWGPLEPFDDSMPQILKERGVYTHIATDHMHYFEEGGCTYHQRYNSWEVSRGQEGDPWKADVENLRNWNIARYLRQDAFNRTLIRDEQDFPMTQTFSKGIEFLDHNHKADDWLLTIETFDPHEPFYVPKQYQDLYRDRYDGNWPDWPNPRMGQENLRECQFAYAALVSMCDANLGRLLDRMDAYGLWEDTLLLVNTDHGFLLGEHGGCGKVPQPYYRQVCNTPFLVWDPRSRAVGRRQSLTQTIDIAPTLLEYFGAPISKDMLGQPLGETIASDKPVRQAALFGVHSHATCITDGRYILSRMPRQDVENNCFNYTLMPTHMHDFFSLEELQTAELAQPFSFTKGLRPLRVQAGLWSKHNAQDADLLFDTQEDPEQDHPCQEEATTQRLLGEMRALFDQNDAPRELYQRMGL